MFDRYVDINTYQCRIKALKQQLEDLRSGNAMKKLREAYERLLDERDKTIRALEMQLAQAYAQIVHVRELWMQVLDDVEKEHQKQVDALMREIKRLEQRVLDVERQGDEVKDKLREKIKEYYAVATELEEEKGKNLKLTAQVNRDFMNSLTPSSQQGPARKKIPNSREKTGRRRGGQPGHKDIQGMPLAGYVGTAVHDHDHTFYNYGQRHQECMQHNCRYLIGSMENEPEREWNKKCMN